MEESPTMQAAPLPRLKDSLVVVPPPSANPGSWAGAPSAMVHGGRIYLAYRLRRPVAEGRGYANVVAVSDDGVHFTTLAEIHRDSFGGESLERPALAVTTAGRWRLYVSVATPETKHWRVDLIEADSPEEFPEAEPLTVLPGDDNVGIKDPVIYKASDGWHLWASVHPLEVWNEADRMTTEYATSPDGVSWLWHGPVLEGRVGSWDGRGARVTDVTVSGTALVATYDGRASATENWEEATGVAFGSCDESGVFGALTATDHPPLRSPYAGGGLRYVSAIALPDGSTRVYYEFTRPDGAHELRTELLVP